MNTKPHAVVIGSGFGGLAAAVRLGARGYDVTVLEKLDRPGGRAYVYKQDGFTFDAGPTIVTAPFLLEELWTLCGKELSDDIDLRSLDPFYRIQFDDGTKFDYSGDPATMREAITHFAPEDVEGFERFMTMSGRIFDVAFTKLADQPFGSPFSMLKIAPELLLLQSYRTVYGIVSSFIRNEKLRTILSFHPLLIGGNPFTSTSVYALISSLERRFGVHFAMGGTGALVTGLVGLIEGQGGKLRCETEVEQILHENGRACGVRLKSGENIKADVVVSNADAAFTYKKLLSQKRRRRWTDRRLQKTRYSMSLFVWYFGTRRQYSDVMHHTIIMGPRYRELLHDIFSRKILADDFSLYLHRPTATDPSLAPPGCDTFYVLSPVPHQESGIDWSEAAEPYRRSIEQSLEASILPGLSESVVTSRCLTPADFAGRLNSVNGAAFSLEPILSQSAWFRPNNRSEELRNLFLVGAGTHPGAGLPGVISSARVLDKIVPDAADVR